MGRVKIIFPAQNPLFTTSIPVRITDINYGNHLGNDSMLSIIHEARMQLLAQWDYDELNVGGNGLIMADVMIAFKNEAFYGENLKVEIYVDEITEKSFDLLYLITARRKEQPIPIAHAKTGMVCFDYEQRKITSIKQGLKSCLQGMKN